MYPLIRHSSAIMHAEPKAMNRGSLPARLAGRTLHGVIEEQRGLYKHYLVWVGDKENGCGWWEQRSSRRTDLPGSTLAEAEENLRYQFEERRGRYANRPTWLRDLEEWQCTSSLVDEMNKVALIRIAGLGK